MGNAKLPAEVLEARGRSHLSRKDIERMKEKQVKPLVENMEPPEYLNDEQKETFYEYADKLCRMRIFSDTDIDTLARYIVSNDLFIEATERLNDPATHTNPKELDMWSKMQDRYFKQCRTCATDLGMTITSRARLVVPEPKVEEKSNKFAKFEKK